MSYRDNISARVRVDVASSYDVLIGKSLISHLYEIMLDEIENSGEKKPDKVFCFSDSNVWEIYKNDVLSGFNLNDTSKTMSDSEVMNSPDWKRQDGKPREQELNTFFNVAVLPPGEKTKSPQVLIKCMDALALSGCTRDSVVIAFGGGVICDLAGFAAATFMRGIRVLQVPTSLLAMVDASVGGKTGVDLQSGKNLFGAFHQPIAVVADLNVLKTLSDPQFCDSVGEIVKHSVLADPSLLDFLTQNRLTKQMVSLDGFADIVKRNVEIKRDIVSADEHEEGARQTLNLGHTIGHAIEAANGYNLGHGACVACGLCMLVKACAKAGITQTDVAEKIVRACEVQGLPTSANVETRVLIDYMRTDKKRHGDKINFVVVKAIGDCEIMPFNVEDVEKLLSC